jgi:hypothetical protein
MLNRPKSSNVDLVVGSNMSGWSMSINALGGLAEDDGTVRPSARAHILFGNP